MKLEKINKQTNKPKTTIWKVERLKKTLKKILIAYFMDKTLLLLTTTE